MSSLDVRIDRVRIATGRAAGAGAWLHDGEPASLGVRGGKIELEVDDQTPAERVIDAHGSVVCPGFIDIHAHSDYAALYAPTALSKLFAGYTTELNGNCGYGAFPLAGAMKEQRQAEYERFGLEVDWDDVDSYFRRCRNSPMALNQGLLIGHGTLRGSVMGLDARPAGRDEIRTMQRHVERAMRAGCFGMSTGLVYAPGSFAEAAEIRGLAEVVAHHDGLYASHLRSESDELVEALDEFLSVCEITHCRAQYSHIKTSGRRNWGKLQTVRRRIDRAKDTGVEVCGDRYPYVASNTDLATILLPNAVLGGGREAVIGRLKDTRQRADLRQTICDRERIDTDGDGWFDRVVISGVHDESLRSAEGLTLRQWADHAGEMDVLSAAFDLLIADDLWTQGIHFSMSEENLRTILSWPDVMVGSDSSLRDTVGSACCDRPHPRAFGTPARILGQFVREMGWLTLEEAIHKMTGLPARVMRLTERGTLATGHWADLVIFDPQTIEDRATYTAPATPPVGIQWVLVNGEIAVSSNGSTEPHATYATPGRLLEFAS
jgi:N-acyl-D-amino-acid deacylase